jgi:hypothetical protein
MGPGRVGREVVTSLTLPATGERWLPAGAVVVAVAYPLWVGATAAAFSSLMEFVGLGLAFDPWSVFTGLIALTAFLLWVVAPAAIVAMLAIDRLTNHNDNIAKHYRLHHPSLLLVPPLLLLAVGVAGLARLGTVWYLSALLLVGAGYLHLRGVAYAARVFALSWPRAIGASLFLSTAALAVTVQVSAALAVGSRGLLVRFAGGVGRFFGLPGVTDVALGVLVPIFGLELPAPIALAAGVPVVIVGSYVLVQNVVGLRYRIQQPDLEPAALSVGQRYPAFAHTPELANSRKRAAGVSIDAATTAPTDGGTTAGASDAADASEPAATGTTATDDSDQGPTRDATGEGESWGDEPTSPTEPESEPSEPETAEQEVEEASDTRVFTPPDSADEIDEAPASFGDDADSTAANAGPTVCPDCGRTLDGDEYTFCPRCGADVSS